MWLEGQVLLILGAFFIPMFFFYVKLPQHFAPYTSLLHHWKPGIRLFKNDEMSAGSRDSNNLPFTRIKQQDIFIWWQMSSHGNYRLKIIYVGNRFYISQLLFWKSVTLKHHHINASWEQRIWERLCTNSDLHPGAYQSLSNIRQHLQSGHLTVSHMICSWLQQGLKM